MHQIQNQSDILRQQKIDELDKLYDQNEQNTRLFVNARAGIMPTIIYTLGRPIFDIITRYILDRSIEEFLGAEEELNSEEYIPMVYIPVAVSIVGTVYCGAQAIKIYLNGRKIENIKQSLDQ